MSAEECRIENCANAAKADGLCRDHALKAIVGPAEDARADGRHGRLITDGSGECRVPGCSRPARLGGVCIDCGRPDEAPAVRERENSGGITIADGGHDLVDVACERCGHSPAGAIVDGEVLCGECARVEQAITDGGRETERLPWCPNCEAFAVPSDDGECGDCGTDVVYKEGLA